MTFILASGSSTRRRMLEDAGLAFAVEAPRIDEREVEANFATDAAADPAGLAVVLAAAKALTVGVASDKPVVGADQVLAFDGEILHKPASRDEAARQLARLAGAAHWLHTAAVIAERQQIGWQCVVSARLTVRPLTGAEIETYLDRVGDAALESVGGYRIEGPGAALFSAIEGDFFAILGLPLLPLIGALRERGAVP